eukprot:1148988-Pelagomonas_calceolata.AAC.3
MAVAELELELLVLLQVVLQVWAPHWAPLAHLAGLRLPSSHFHPAACPALLPAALVVPQELLPPVPPAPAAAWGSLAAVVGVEHWGVARQSFGASGRRAHLTAEGEWGGPAVRAWGSQCVEAWGSQYVEGAAAEVAGGDAAPQGRRVGAEAVVEGGSGVQGAGCGGSMRAVDSSLQGRKGAGLSGSCVDEPAWARNA